ncbi:thioredoxin family protein [Candidatus Uabimicrobium amorphum]|uniref:Thioredoxin n=1 Tax=Uabimicrobium amorphum TaxID=2596890 RepID=A0A5S9ILK8_UABAM|nr:thioredoxin domain-containing protein [Candidatus Uabimicrobium amorphum]BBM84119.1 thioredoxin [Candidatus Uabimicrobium amorphum]
MSRFLILLAVLCIASSFTAADLKELANAQEFEKAIADAKVPVVVQFSAYWCNPCKKLKKTISDVSTEYTDDQILFYYVDAYVNSELKKYIDGGYPTTRSFTQKKMGASFVGSKSAKYVKSFVSKVISKRVAEDNKLIELASTQEFNDMISKSESPVFVQFSAHWCNPCQRLKEKVKNIAPQYNATEIKFCYVDAYENPELKSYLEGGYPTSKIFTKGKANGEFLVGDKSEAQVKKFVDNAIGVKVSAANAVIEFKNTQEFELALKSSDVPMMVQFSAHWCSPCKRLRKTLDEVAPLYSEDKIQICYVDAYVNTELRKYLDGGYPTVKVFFKGKLTKSSFVGDKTKKFVNKFVSGIIKDEQK